MLYADVVINRAILRAPKKTVADIPLPNQSTPQVDNLATTFHYHVPSHLHEQIQVGQLVAVPFRTEQLPAIILNLSPHSSVEETRPIEAILSLPPMLTTAQIEVAYWLSHTYLAPLSEAVQQFLPHGIGTRWEYLLKPITAPTNPQALNLLTAPARILLTYLRKYGKARLAEVEPEAAERLIELGLAYQETALARPKVRPQMERTIELLIPPDEIEAVIPTLGRPSKQAEVLRHLAALDDPLPALEDVWSAIGCTEHVTQALAEKGHVEVLPAQTLLMVGRQVEENDADDDSSHKLLRYLQSKPHPIPQVMALSETDTSMERLESLIEAGFINRFEEPTRITLRLPISQLTETVIDLRQAHKYVEVLTLLQREEGSVWLGWVLAQTSATMNTIKRLAEAEIINMGETRRWRDPLADKIFTLEKAPTLTPQQQQVWQAIKTHNRRKPMLLHGVTGSGKTEIYFRAIDMVIQTGKQAMLLVPEITLATQMVARVSARFPGQVAIWHSALSPGERYDNWERVRNGALSIVVGARSALFAPLHQLGIIIVDEEHDSAYKNQHHQPYFHAREMAITLAKRTDSLLILGSASPDIESRHRAELGVYHYLEMPHRVLAHTQHLLVQERLLQRSHQQKVATSPSESLVSLPLPTVQVIDLRDELRAGNRAIFSRALQKGIEETLERGEQVILFLNRRGAATFVNCRDCGYVQQCPDCDTTMSYHTQGELLVCHYCGYRAQPHEICPSCQSPRIRYFGLGTQRVEDAVRRHFPQAQVLRWDQDSSRQVRNHELFLHHFMSGQANVMVGTQMVTKGLDLPLVTLVGVISADTSLYLPDFRAGERTFQLLMQVAGRAGRSPLGGRVIIQSYQADLPVIQAAAQHDYKRFYQMELAFRREQQYPPFKRLAMLHYSGPGQTKAFAEAHAMRERLQQYLDGMGFPAVSLIGPTPHYVQRLRDQFRWFILLRANDPAEVLRPLMPLPRGWKVDIDPMSLM